MSRPVEISARPCSCGLIQATEAAEAQLAKQDEVIASLRAALPLALEALDEVYRAHRDKDSPDFNDCGDAPCAWCDQVDQFKAAVSGQPDAARENGKLEAVPEPADQDDYTGHYLVGVIDNIDIGCTLQQIRGGLIDLLKRRNKRQREASGDAAREDQP